ncbi:MAG: helix-turn-helix transcriptional regulator [Bacillota bacterium]|nr:helix-turn-helix transcriptional regulator [Bacillota bacterium]
MNTVTAVRNRILQLCNERNITINALATISGLLQSFINNIIYVKSLNHKIVTIKMICDGLNITLGEFFSTTEFNSLEQELK